MRGALAASGVAFAVVACSSAYGGAPETTGADASAPDAAADAAADAASEAASGCSAAPGEIAFTTRGQVNTVVLDWSSAPLLPAITTRGPCPANTGTTMYPSRAYVLFNGTGAPAKPSAWGVCNTSFDEINVVVYARSTAPNTAAELQGCAGYAGVGSTAPGTPGSPEDVGSGYCNGLAAPDVGITLAPCERAVVLFQHDPTTFPNNAPGPAGARMKLE